MAVLRNALLTDGRVADVGLDGDHISWVGEGEAVGDETDLSGMLLLPAPAEPHAHLDKALTADLVANPKGDLMGAIKAWQGAYPDRTKEEIHGRAKRAAEIAVRQGITALRTHVDVGEVLGTKGIEALIAIRGEMAHLIDIQLVALIARPLLGDAGAGNRAALAKAIELGVDLVGGASHLDADPAGFITYILDVAEEAQLPVDLHVDETLDVDMLSLLELAKQVRDRGFPHQVTASHCVSLGVQDIATQQQIAKEVADAHIGIVTLPQTNLFLQARDVSTSAPRGLTAIAALRDAGATVAGGADNLQDPFNTVGRGDAMETAALLVMAGHLSPDDAYDAVSGVSRQVMGLPVAAVEPGAPAELVAIRAATLREAVASAPADRTVIHKGTVVCRTEVNSTRL